MITPEMHELLHALPHTYEPRVFRYKARSTKKAQFIRVREMLGLRNGLTLTSFIQSLA